MVTDTNREYELVVIVSHEADEDETATALEIFTKFISDHGGSVSGREDWGIKRLPYPIQNYREGNYFLFKFDLLLLFKYCNSQFLVITFEFCDIIRLNFLNARIG